MVKLDCGIRSFVEFGWISNISGVFYVKIAELLLIFRVFIEET